MVTAQLLVMRLYSTSDNNAVQSRQCERVRLTTHCALNLRIVLNCGWHNLGCWMSSIWVPSTCSFIEASMRSWTCICRAWNRGVVLPTAAYCPTIQCSKWIAGSFNCRLKLPFWSMHSLDIADVQQRAALLVVLVRLPFMLQPSAVIKCQSTCLMDNPWSEINNASTWVFAARQERPDCLNGRCTCTLNDPAVTI